MNSDDQPFPFIHDTYFVLADRLTRTRSEFLNACHRYLADHEGQREFSLSVRATEMQRPVNDQEFDVLMHMVFDNKSDYEKYATHSRHNEFITAVAGLSVSRRVFDAYIVPAKA